MKNKFQRGLTLTELMVTVAIGAILVSVATPSFKSLIEGGRATATVNAYVSFLQSARSEAIKRNSSVTVCQSSSGESCSQSTSWEQGWIAFVDPDEDGQVEDIDGDNAIAKGVELLRIHGEIKGTFRSNLNAISFSSKGRASDSSTFTFCDDDATEVLGVVVRESGRYSVSEVSHTGEALSCP